MLAGMGAFVCADKVEGFLGNRTHRLDVLVKAQIEHRPHMQAADGCVRIPGAAGAVLLENVGQPGGVFGEVLERHCAILDEGDRLSLLLHRHHDIEPGGTHVVDGGLQLGIEHFDHATRFRPALVPAKTEIADKLPQPQQTPKVLAGVLFRELDKQDGWGSPCTTASMVGWNIAISRANPSMVRSMSSTAIGPSFTICCATSMASEEIAEMTGTDRAASKHRRKLQLDARGESERAFRTHQDMRQIEVVATGDERVEIIAADAALDLGKFRLDLLGLLRGEAKSSRASGSRGELAGRSDRSRADRPKCSSFPSASTASIERTFSRVLP